MDFEQQLLWAKGLPVLPRDRCHDVLDQDNQVCVITKSTNTYRHLRVGMASLPGALHDPYWQDVRAELQPRGLGYAIPGVLPLQAAPTGAPVRLAGAPAPPGINQGGLAREANDPLEPHYQVPGEQRRTLESAPRL